MNDVAKLNYGFDIKGTTHTLRAIKLKVCSNPPTYARCSNWLKLPQDQKTATEMAELLCYQAGEK